MISKITISSSLDQDLAIAIAECSHDKTFILADTMTRDYCWPLLRNHPSLKDASFITIDATDANKTLESLTHVWKTLGDRGATRHSCMICLGGGMVTDLGGFAASTFKRGINYINIPTTLLAMVDASVGGKTGINFNGLKNEIGAFSQAADVIISTRFLKTLDDQNLRSGFAEMLKHGLISDQKKWASLINFDLFHPDLDQLQQMVAESIAVKANIVEQDPYEQGIRKALNLGHTIGHAFESWSLQQGHPILHGYAVAYGLICELYLSCVKTDFPTDKMRTTVDFIKQHYGKLSITCDDYPALTALMKHDKKNRGDDINFTLLGEIGDIRINQTASIKEIEEAMDFLREC